MSWPLVGAIPFMDKTGVGALLDEQLRKYGKIARVDLGRLRFFVINDFGTAKDLFNRDITSNRPVSWLHKYLKGFNGKICGIIHASGATWREQRRFALKNLRDFGFGRKSLDHVIHEEAQLLIKSLLEEHWTHGDILIGTTFNAPVVNVLWQVVASTRFDPNAQKTKDMMEKLTERFKAGLTWSSAFPFLNRYLPLSKFNQDLLDFKAMIRKEVIAHEQDHDPDLPPRDFMDVYISEISSQTHPESSNFHREQLVTICTDFFQAGSETSSTTLAWCVLYMALNPEVQSRCSSEIQDTIGATNPTLDDINRLVYTRATVMEVQRISVTAPGSLLHITSEDIHMEGFVIPKKSIMIANQKSFLMDECVWPNPEAFMPDRFIGANGKIVKPEQFVPFGIGPRICMGESLAKSEIFIFFVMLLQHLQISSSKTYGPPNPKNLTTGITTIPDPFHVHIEPRT
eukprot:snap_masked-scaffold1422_size42147-processed-gene-0.1 protein:Tk11335 transcript:snap_masked-scaffold1422_size42147-processed-gene-0.1-mRNA-1 annotation:"cytochrome p450 2aa2"